MGTWSSIDFELALRSIDFPKESQIFIHSSLGMLGMHEEGKPAGGILNCFERLSESGTKIYLPAFTYSVGLGQVFNPRSENGLSQMGALSIEAFSRKYHRSFDPIFSVLTNDSDFHNQERDTYSGSFGLNSFFSTLIDSNAWVVNIGTGIGTTLLHEIERRIGVPYRFDKDFDGQFLDHQDKICRFSKWRSYVRDLGEKNTEADFRLLNRLTNEESFVSRIKFGKTEINAYRIQEMYTFVDKTIAKLPNLLNKSGIEDLKSIEAY